MRFRAVLLRCVALIIGVSIGTVFLVGVTFPARAQGRSGAAPAPRVHGTLLQVMRGILYPASNVIFAAQVDDPATIKPASPDASMSPNPLTSTYGGWTPVENSALALAQAANLLLIAGRRCGNGRPAPIRNADWQMWVEGLRDAGMAAYKAAQSKNQDAFSRRRERFRMPARTATTSIARCPRDADALAAHASRDPCALEASGRRAARHCWKYPAT